MKIFEGGLIRNHLTTQNTPINTVTVQLFVHYTDIECFRNVKKLSQIRSSFTDRRSNTRHLVHITYSTLLSATASSISAETVAFAKILVSKCDWTRGEAVSELSPPLMKSLICCICVGLCFFFYNQKDGEQVRGRICLKLCT